MRIHKVTIVASPSDSDKKEDMRNYTWTDAQHITELESAEKAIHDFIVETKATVAMPIEP